MFADHHYMARARADPCGIRRWKLHHTDARWSKQVEVSHHTHCMSTASPTNAALIVQQRMLRTCRYTDY